MFHPTGSAAKPVSPRVKNVPANRNFSGIAPLRLDALVGQGDGAADAQQSLVARDQNALDLEPVVGDGHTR